MGTIQKKGTLEALNFCNKKAYPITDSMAKAQNATIINQFKTDIANKITSKPVIEEQNNFVNFLLSYYH